MLIHAAHRVIFAAKVYYSGDAMTTPKDADHRAATRTKSGAQGRVRRPSLGSQAHVVDGRSARRIVSKQRIEDAAMELFATRGYSGATLDEIADVAGVTKGTIFNNYRNKSELFEHLLRESARDMAQQMVDARRGLTGWEALHAATLKVAQLVDEAPAPSLLVGAELFRRGQPWESAVVEARALLIAPITEVLAEIGAGRAAKGQYFVPPEQRPNVAIAILGALVSSTLDRATYSPDRPLAATHSVLIGALRAEI